MNPKVDEYLNKAKKWQQELKMLRRIVLDTQLVEELKWGVPCYTFDGKNVIMLNAFKEYCTLSFLKGVLLNDTDAILVAPGENSQSARQIRFTHVDEIIKLEPTLKAYIFETIEVEKAGLKVNTVENKDLVFSDELTAVLTNNAAFKVAFEALTPGRQRAYHIFFSAAKQAKSRESRIEKYTPRILIGKGMNDCVCGHSKRFPNCDGSHKYFNHSGQVD
ncbi:MAG: DUF1801 domain-containing protein [Bacteroidetes bacterium]|nr:DUF1801 domain-containing protein [Bacteroidota bacterium]MBU1372350.1 DUF1801 domain-containing protein [Bacteroidota bacterium]MBU1483374.1 DUF1801 domain-containing protein [Bacteroidota bacterium]MBU1760835.1 DUF1801 domain-containing protein [Bacteroidota bacterium]MBU2267188.1 DUF1801 domain-containing protein [Bacteroidota bacterium]